MYDANMKNRKINTNRGFIALISAIIISAVLLTLSASVSVGSFSSRFSALNAEYKQVSLSLAESCVNMALLKIGQNYSYTTTGDTVAIGADSCSIKSVSCVSGCAPSDPKKTITIKTQAQYKGAFSNVVVSATAQNPALSPSLPAPTCTFTSSSQSILAGQTVTLGWATAGSATSFTVVRSMGGVDTTIYSGPITGSPITNTPTESATYTATVTGPGGSTQCVSPQQVEVHPAVACAETVVMLAGGMSSGDRTNEGVAAKALFDLYKVVTPVPHVGIGSFGGLDGSAAQVPTAGQLTGTYGSSGTGLYAVTDQITSTVNSSAGTNLSAGIAAAQNELNSVRHQAGFERVMIFISDGKPIDPGSAGQATAAAVTASDVAKVDGIHLFSVHYGTNSGRDLVAQLATGAYPYAAHQSGSYNDAGLSNNQTEIDAENTDDDGFFIAPTSADMKTIFEAIGKKVCPAAIPPPPLTPPSTPAVPSLPPNITLGSWEEVPTTP